MNQNVVVLSGGTSEEREVSLVSSREIASGLNAKGYQAVLLDPAEYTHYSDMVTFIRSQDPYIVFNGLHGGSGEDGRIQA
ncbi:MAG TPA: D-alanine--D-alanine ligase, partial [Candidatus Cloacimonadota bacterium]|nr:D-alanine--D-alanine ligase [Candidatus Cloacimonadota bacterium]